MTFPFLPKRKLMEAGGDGMGVFRLVCLWLGYTLYLRANGVKLYFLNVMLMGIYLRNDPLLEVVHKVPGGGRELGQYYNKR